MGYKKPFSDKHCFLSTDFFVNKDTFQYTLFVINRVWKIIDIQTRCFGINNVFDDLCVLIDIVHIICQRFLNYEASINLFAIGFCICQGLKNTPSLINFFFSLINISLLLINYNTISIRINSPLLNLQPY